MAYFDQIILAIDADSCLKLLHGEASFMEKRVLGNVKYLYDVTVTHNDLQYMEKVCLFYYYSTLVSCSHSLKFYEVNYDPRHNASIPADSSTEERKAAEDAFQFAEKNFRPLYYTMQYPQDKSKIEMSFDLTHYQPQFRGEKPAGPFDRNDTSKHRNECRRMPTN